MDRKEAFKLGLQQYDTGKPCRNGHNAPRYTTSGACIKCIAGYAKLYKKDILSNAMGAVTYSCSDVHPADVPAMDAYAQALAFERRAARDREIDGDRAAMLGKMHPAGDPLAPPLIDGYTVSRRSK